MVIEISLELLDKLKLNPNEFLVMELIRHKENKIAINFLKDNFTREQAEHFFKKVVDNEYVTQKSYVQNDYDWTEVKVSNEYKLLTREEDLFEEFVNEYPKSVTRTDGTTDYLRTDLKAARLYYAKYTMASRAKHEHLLKCLKYEVEERQREGSMKFMIRMVKWLNTQAWTAYEDKLLDERVNQPVDNTKYGTEIE